MVVAIALPILVLKACVIVGVTVVLAAAGIAMRQRVERGQRVCIRCGCTDDHACPGGCWWISSRPWICSRCPD